MKLSTREQNLLWIILVFLIGFLVYNYSYTPLQEEIETLKSKSSELEFEVEKLQGIELLIETSKKEITEYQDRLKNDHNDIPATWDQAELLYHSDQIIGKSATKRQVTLEINDDEEIEVASGFVNLNIAANYKNLNTILDSFENSKYLNELTAMSIMTKEEEEVRSEDFDISLTFMFYNKDSVNFYAEYEFMNGKYGKNELFK